MNDIEKIHFIRKSNYAGYNLDTTINMQELNTEEASELKKILEESGICSPTQSFINTGEDLFSYSITLEGPDKAQTVIIDQKDVNNEKEKLISYLTNKAKA